MPNLYNSYIIETKIKSKAETTFVHISMCVSIYVCSCVRVCVSVCVCRWVIRFHAVNFLKHSYKLTCACVRIHRLCKFIASFWHNDANKCELSQFFTYEIRKMQLIHKDFTSSLITHNILPSWICLKLLNIV